MKFQCLQMFAILLSSRYEKRLYLSDGLKSRSAGPAVLSVLGFGLTFTFWKELFMYPISFVLTGLKNFSDVPKVHLIKSSTEQNLRFGLF